MATWFARGLRKGVVTTGYPRATDAWAAGLPTPPVFDERRISGSVAGRLVAICPSRALTKDDRALVFDVGACTACGACMREMVGIARPSGVFELAATERSQLVKRVQIALGEVAL